MSPLGGAFRKAMEKGSAPPSPENVGGPERHAGGNADAIPTHSPGGTTGATRIIDQAAPALTAQRLDFAGRGFVATFAEQELGTGGDHLLGLRAALAASGLDRTPTMILVAGAARGSGTPAVAAGLALELARDLSLKVLLMDANVAQPELGDSLEIAPELDLLDVLHGRTEPADAIVHSEADNLSALVLRPGLSASALAGPSADAVFEQLSQAFDYVVADVGDVERSAAARVMAKRSGSVVLVLPAGISRSRARAARSAITSAGGAIVGAVLTGAVED